jgi:CrcB protein
MTNVGFTIVFLGAGIGGALRHGMNLAVFRLLGTAFPFGTLAINILGSFVMGLVAEYWALNAGLPQSARLFLTTGVLGGFTTFSAFSLETALLSERGQWGPAALYVCASVTLSVGSLFVGLLIIRMLVGAEG